MLVLQVSKKPLSSWCACLFCMLVESLCLRGVHVCVVYSEAARKSLTSLCACLLVCKLSVTPYPLYACFVCR